MSTNVNNSTGLSTKQLESIDLLCSGKTQKATAKKIGVTPETIIRWKKEETYLAVLNRTKLDAWEAIQQRLANIVGDAMDVLEDAVTGDDVSSIQLKAVDMVLKMREKPKLDTITKTTTLTEMLDLADTYTAEVTPL